MSEVFEQFGVPEGQIPYAARIVDGVLVGVSYDPAITEYLGRHDEMIQERVEQARLALAEHGLTWEEYWQLRDIPEVERIMNGERDDTEQQAEA